MRDKRLASVVIVAMTIFWLESLWRSQALSQNAEANPPEKMVYETKNGKVTFEHTKHIEREKQNCKVCHDKLFPKKKAPLQYAKNVHKLAEAGKYSCAACHVAEGKAFASKGNCKKCHVKV